MTTGTTEAWVKRGTERHELLKKLIKKVSEMESSIEEEGRIWFELDFI